MKKVYLLDLHSTLVDAPATRKPWELTAEMVPLEGYSIRLVKELQRREGHVILVTWRQESLQEISLATILQKTQWSPDEAFFRVGRMKAPEWKEHCLDQFIFPKYGSDTSLYLAIESNVQTRAMYKRRGIEAVKRDEFIGSGALWPQG